MNQLKVAEVQAILTLASRGWSFRRIAEALGIRRETVSKYVQEWRAAPKAAKAPTGSDEADGPGAGPAVGLGAAMCEPEPAEAPTGSEAQSAGRSGCERYRPLILAKLELGLSAQRIWQDLEAEHQAAVSYYSVRRFVRQLGSGAALPFRRMECAPGHESQVDFGRGAPIVGPGGRKRRTKVFRIVLSCSRKAYSEAVFRETTEEFIRCLESAFRHFGGSTRTLVIDNLRAAVKHPDWYDPELNPKFASFCEHYGIATLPTKPRMPRHKGKVENSIDYVKDNGLKGHEFSTLAQENEHLRTWEATVADTRIHGTTRRQVNRVFEETEKPALLPLPAERFPFFHEAQRAVHRDGHVEVAKAYYAVPPEYRGHTVWARWDGRIVRLYDHAMRPIALHVQQEPGHFSTPPQFLHPRKISGIERGAGHLLERTELIGTQTNCWARAMLQARGIQGVRVLLGVHSLAERHDHAALERACQIAHSHGAYRLRDLRHLLARGGPTQEHFELLEQHEIIRSLDEYTEVARRAIYGSIPSPVPDGVVARDVSGPGDPPTTIT
jgi:transposase